MCQHKFEWRAPVSGPLPKEKVLLRTDFDDWHADPMAPSESGRFVIDRMVRRRLFFVTSGSGALTMTDAYGFRFRTTLSTLCSKLMAQFERRWMKCALGVPPWLSWLTN